MVESRRDEHPVAAAVDAGDLDEATAMVGVALVVLVGAVWMALGAGFQFTGSDMLVPVYASLYHWTPFYWGQTRLGLPIPLLASPISDPVANLLTQRAVGFALGLLLPFLLARWWLGPRRWVVAGALGAATLVAVLHRFWLHFFFVEQCYIQSATVALAGVLVLESPRFERRAAGWLLLAIAFWITPSTLLWIAPMFLLCSLYPPAEARHGVWPDLGLVLRLAWIGVLALALAWAGRIVPGVAVTPLGLARPADWPATWGVLARGTLTRLPSAWPMLIAALVLFLAGTRLLRRAPEGRRRAERLALAFAVGAAAQILGAGLFVWVAQARTAQFGWRFAIPSIVLALLVPPLALAALLPAAAGTRARSGWSRLRPGLLVLALPLVVLALRFEPPSMARTRDALEIDVRSGLHLDPFARELVERRATHFLAPYWLAYPMAFRANILLYDAGESRMVWPLAPRAEAARSSWEPADWATARIAVLRRMPLTTGRAKPPTFELDTNRRSLALPELERVESGDLVDIYRGRGAALPPG